MQTCFGPGLFTARVRGRCARPDFREDSGDETVRPYSAGPDSSRSGALVVLLVLLALAGCQKPIGPARPAGPDGRRGRVEADERADRGFAQRDDPGPGERDDPGRVRGFLTERHFVEGAMVRKGQLLLVIDEEPYQVAVQLARLARPRPTPRSRRPRNPRGGEVSAAQVELDQAMLRLAQIQEKRSRGLVTRNAGSAEELDKTEADRKRWESQVEADRAHLSQAKADYDVGIASARAQVSAAKAAARDAELNLGYCRMHAPIDGRIGEARVKVGNLVGPDPAGGGAYTDLATIQQLDPMGVDVRLSSRDLDRTTALIDGGLPVRLIRPGPAGPLEHPYDGTCFFIDNTVDETTSTFLVKAKIPNPGGKLLPGEYVKVRMVVDRLKNAVVVPTTSVIESDSGTIVHVVDKDGKVAIPESSRGRPTRGCGSSPRGSIPACRSSSTGSKRSDRASPSRRSRPRWRSAR